MRSVLQQLNYRIQAVISNMNQEDANLLQSEQQRLSFSNNAIFQNDSLKQEYQLPNQLATANFSSLGQSSISQQQNIQETELTAKTLYLQQQQSQQLDSSKDQIDMNESFQSQELYDLGHPIHLQSRHLENQSSQPKLQQVQQSSSLSNEKQQKEQKQKQQQIQKRTKPMNQSTGPQPNASTPTRICKKNSHQRSQDSQSRILNTSQGAIEEPQIIENSKVQAALKPQTFDFQNLRKSSKKRQNQNSNQSASLGTVSGSVVDPRRDELNKFQHIRNNSSLNHHSKATAGSRSQSQSSKHRAVIQLSTLPDVASTLKFDDYMKNQQMQDDILNKSIRNEAQTSARLQSQEFNQNLKLAHVFALNSLQDLSEKNQPSNQAKIITKSSQSLDIPNMALLSARQYEHSVLKDKALTQKTEEVRAVANLNEGIQEVEEEGNESPLKAMQIARRQSVLNSKLQAASKSQTRRESFFGSQHMVTPDPLKKLLQTKRYLNSDAILQQQLSSGLMTDRMQTRKQSIQDNGLVKHTATLKSVNQDSKDQLKLQDSYNQTDSNEGTLSFRNELLKRTLNSNGLDTQLMSGQHSVRTKTPELLNRRNSVNKSAVDVSQHSQYLKYRDQLLLKSFGQSQEMLSKQLFKPQPIQLNQLSTISTYQAYGKSPNSAINDSVQQALIAEHVGEYNKETAKYNSVLIHLGVLLKRAVSTAEHNHAAMNVSSSAYSQSLPSYFITTICCQIFDKIAVFFPQFSKILVPLKNSLFQSIFHNYNFQKHFAEDERELEASKNHLDLTKKDARITLKYLSYETYHDKVMQLTRENKELKKEVVRMGKDHHDEQKQRKIIKNLVEKFRRMRTRETLKKVLTSLRFHSNSKYQGLFSQVISNAILGQDIRNKTVQRRYFNQLKLFAKDSKLRKAKKEIEYYQNKNDDLDDNNSNQKMQIRDLGMENQKLKAMLMDKNKQLAVHESEMSQFQIDSSKKKPTQIRECLKVYFKFMYTNPLISRLRLRNISQPNGLFALSHTSNTATDLTVGSSQIQAENQGDSRLQRQDQLIPVDMSLLLKKRETVLEGGPGLSVLMSLSLRDLMVRWANFMVEKATNKLNPIIQILKQQIQLKRQIRLQSRRQGLRSRGRKQNQDLERLITGSPERSTSSDDCSSEERKSNNQQDQMGEDDFELQLGLHNNKTDFFKDYEPFSNFRQDLKLLMTFKQMISKVISEFQLGMVNSGILQAILFVIDQSERQIEITVSHLATQTLPALPDQAALRNHQASSLGNKQTPSMMRGLSQLSNLPEQETTEDVTVPDYKYLLSYVSNINIDTRVKLLVEQIEKLHHQKFDWYFSLSELLTGKEQNYTTVLLYLFYNFPCLENSSFQSSLYLSAKRAKHQSSHSVSHDRSLKQASISSATNLPPDFSQQLIQQEMKLNLQVYKKLLYNSRQKILPLLLRKVNSHLHDVSLLYSQDELDRQNANPLEQLLELPFVEPKQLMIRWVNHLLRSYHEIRIQYELEAKFRSKFVKEKRHSSTNLNDQPENLSPIYSPIRNNPFNQANPSQQQNQNESSKQNGRKSHNHPEKREDSTSPARGAKSQSRNQALNGGKTTGRQTQVSNNSIKKRKVERESEPTKRRRGNKFRVVQDNNTQQLMKQYNLLNPDLEDLGFEISNTNQLSQENHHRLILILAFLTPETLWDMYDMDYVEMRRHQHYVELVEDFVHLANFDEKVLFIMNAVIRITKKNNLISMNDLYLKGKIKYTDLLIELFLARPCLNNSRHNSHFMASLQTIEDFYNSQKKYLHQFNKKNYDEIDEHVKLLREQREDLQEAFTFIQDCDRIFSTLKEKLLLNKLSFPNPHTIIARQMNIYERSELLMSEIEKSILFLNRSFLFQLLTFRQAQQGAQWTQQIEQVIRKYLYPIRRYLNIYIDKEGFISYFDMWRAIKSLNVRSFIVDSREVEAILIKILKLKDTRLASKKNLMGPKFSANNLAEDSLNGGMSALEEGLGLTKGSGFEQAADLFMKKIKSEIQYTVFSNKRGGSTQRFRTKSSLVKEIEESLENVYLKTQLYRAKFSASDLILVLIAILFRQNPSDFVRELTQICPSLYEEGVKNVNKMLSKEKIGVHVEAYLTEYSPSLLFEQFLIHNVLIKSEFSKKHPFRINMMKDDFRSFLDHYLNSLFAVFDFYLHEFSMTAPQPVQFMQFCIQVEAVYGLLRDFNAFSQESGLTKTSLKKILLNVQRQIGSLEQVKLQNLRQNGISGLDQYSAVVNSQNTPSKATKPTNSQAQGTMNNSGSSFYRAAASTNLGKSSSPFSNTKQQTLPNLNSSAENLLTQQLTQEGGLESLTFFEFMESLYLVAQYYNPDPFTNANQKFADFLERQVFVNIQFKIKSKKLQDSPHKKNLIKSLQNHKVIRGASLDTFNNYFELQ